MPGTGSPAGGRLDRLALRVTESAQEPFRLGRVIGRSFSIWRRNLGLLFALVLVVSSPRILYAVYGMLTPPPEPPPPPDGPPEPLFVSLAPILLLSTGVALMRSLFIHLSQAVVIFAVYQWLRGGTATFGQSVRGGLRRVLPVVRVALVLFVLDTSIRLAFFFIVVYVSPLPTPPVGFTVRMGALLGLFVVSPFWVAVPAAVAERSRSFLKRSWILTRRRRLQIFSILLILYAIDWGVGRLYRVVADGLPTPLRVGVWWTQDLLLVALAAVLAVVGYHALRLEKDGVDASDLADVFA